jgi:hypothetical protein
MMIATILIVSKLSQINIADLVQLVAHGLFGLMANPIAKSYG